MMNNLLNAIVILALMATFLLAPSRDAGSPPRGAPGVSLADQGGRQTD
jgi:hypothetical protein